MSKASTPARVIREWRDAVWLATSWLTTLPVPQPRFTIDRVRGARATAMTPLVGAVVGVITAAVARGVSATDLPQLVVGVIAVAVAAVMTRGMHLDGLADTADGLGCYGPPERAREVMRTGSVGPFGVTTLLIVVVTQIALVGALADSGRWTAIVVAALGGRWAAVICCRRGITALRGGFGELVVDSQRWSVIGWGAVVLAVAVADDPARWWRGVAATIAVAVAALAMSRHCARRFGGINGDVLGASIELAATVVLVTYAV